jgi:exodeoxyribonuclease III
MKLATWNVNSVKARKERLIAWLGKHSPDVLCLQETKTEDASFPHEDVREAGYQAVVYGQKTYNGVAILSRTEASDVRRSFEDGVDDPQCRVLAATLHGVRVVNVYVPNGGEAGTEKWAYKLAWLGRLRAYLARSYDPKQPLVLCGDMNIAPDDRDVARPGEWADTVLCHPAVRDEFTALTQWGLSDVLRKHHPDGGVYSWWDYRMLGFPKNNGLRIDHILATEPVAHACTGANVDREERKGKLPSDHAPVIATFEL